MKSLILLKFYFLFHFSINQTTFSRVFVVTLARIFLNYRQFNRVLRNLFRNYYNRMLTGVLNRQLRSNSQQKGNLTFRNQDIRFRAEDFAHRTCETDRPSNPSGLFRVLSIRPSGAQEDLCRREVTVTDLSRSVPILNVKRFTSNCVGRALVLKIAAIGLAICFYIIKI